MMKIAQISDTHFGTEIPAVLEALKVSLGNQKPDLIILSGDITQRARRHQFEKARHFIDSLPCRTLTIPGNHDLPLYDVLTRFTNPYRHYRRIFGEREFSDFQGQIGIVGLDATGPWRHKQGQLDPAHVESLLTTARETIGAYGTLIVAVHQPLLTAWREDRTEEMIGESKVAELFSRLRVDAVLSGHVHVPLICTSEKAYTTLPYAFVHSGAGTACSHRTREGKPNSYNLLQVKDGMITVERYDFSSVAGRFKRDETLSFLRTKKGWMFTGIEVTVLPPGSA